MIELTDAAVARIRKQLAARGHGLGIRLGVKRSGCSGYGYDIDFLDALSDDLQTFPFEGFVLAIPHTDAEMLAGLRRVRFLSERLTWGLCRAGRSTWVASWTGAPARHGLPRAVTLRWTATARVAGTRAQLAIWLRPNADGAKPIFF